MTKPRFLGERICRFRAVSSDAGTDLRHQSANGADSEGSGHGSFEPFAANVANHDERSAVGELPENLIEVAPDFLCGQIGGFDVKAFDCRQHKGHKSLLHFARGLELCFGMCLFATDAREAEEKDKGDGEEEEQVCEVGHLKAEQADGNERIEEVKFLRAEDNVEAVPRSKQPAARSGSRLGKMGHPASGLPRRYQRGAAR